MIKVLLKITINFTWRISSQPKKLRVNSKTVKADFTKT